MRDVTGTELPGSPTSLFDHAMRLHRESPDAPLERSGDPYPDESWHGRGDTPRRPKDRRTVGLDLAALLDAHFADPASTPADLADACHQVHVPLFRTEHVVAAARRVEIERVRRTGRWLVRRGTDRCAVTIGLALLETAPEGGDIPLLQTIGLLSEGFGPLVVDTMARCRGALSGLLWLGDRVEGWGRVTVVEKLCAAYGVHARDWLLRRSCNGEYHNQYFAAEVAIAADLASVITGDDPDLDLVHHTGVLLSAMTDCAGMGLTLDEYPAAPNVLAAHSKHVARLAPTTHRYGNLANLADYLLRPSTREWRGREQAIDRYLTLLNQPEWEATARTGLARGDFRVLWLRQAVGARLDLAPFTS
ncbi:hypothetical protein ACFWM1_07515 [Nocardia sp. NPDC058379]|uniref:hypothetical protein n=1 Tax=unclassified Nocardia TaxID=2637762 RepID=UPI0036617963